MMTDIQNMSATWMIVAAFTFPGGSDAITSAGYIQA